MSSDPDADDDLTPRIVAHPDSTPVSSQNVLRGYANLMRSIREANELMPEGQRFVVPFGVQEAIRRYVDEREVIESLTKNT